MSMVPIKNADTGFVNCVTHALTGSQTLYYLFSIWSENPEQAIVLWYRRGESEFRINAIRVALSKERKVRGLKRTFELRVSACWPHTHDGIKGEAIKVERVGGTIQTRMRAAFQSIHMKG